MIFLILLILAFCLVIAVLHDLIRQLPPTVDILYLQVDGSTENINMVVMCYLQLLVEARRFKEIQLHRLPVGHTHEDISELIISCT